jgi:hypothetical protein
MIPSRSAISSGLVGSALSQPYSAHFSKLIRASHDYHLFAAKHGPQKVIAVSQPRLELIRRIDRRIDRTSNRTFDRRQLHQYFIERYIPYDHQVDIAPGFLVSSRHRSINKRQEYSVCQRRQSGSKGLKNPDRLCNQRVKLRENRVVAICLVVDLPARIRPGNQPEPGEGLQFSLNTSNAYTNLPRNLTGKESLIGMATQHRQNAPAGLAEDQIAQSANIRSHNEVNCTQDKYKDQVIQRNPAAIDP